MLPAAGNCAPVGEISGYSLAQARVAQPAAVDRHRLGIDARAARQAARPLTGREQAFVGVAGVFDGCALCGDLVGAADPCRLRCVDGHALADIAHVESRTWPTLDIAFRGELLVGGHHGATRDAESRCEIARGRQPRTGCNQLLADALPQQVAELYEQRISRATLEADFGW